MTTRLQELQLLKDHLINGCEEALEIQASGGKVPETLLNKCRELVAKRRKHVSGYKVWLETVLAEIENQEQLCDSLEAIFEKMDVETKETL